MITPQKLIYFSAAASAIFAVACLAAYANLGSDLFYSLAVTFCAILYHIIMRMAVVAAVTAVRTGRSDDFAFELGRGEQIFYKAVRTKSWKNRVPTYNPSLFEVKGGNLPALAHNMRNAEVGHTVIAALSFLPMSFSGIFGGFAAFAVTSVLAALFDLQFVFVQRYNRARVCRIIRAESRRVGN